MQAMVAGIFPVDFNGINKDGWTQQGTLLNKANLLSDTVISTLGLSTGADSTPNDAFNVLANIGNVHVWRKTVVAPAGTHITYLTSTNRNAYQEGTDGSEKPAGYKLGSKITGNIALTDRTNESSTIYWNYSDQVDVSDDGEVSLIAPNRVDFNATQSNAVNMAESLVGNFIMTTSSATAIKANTVYFIPDDASVAREMSGTKFVYTTAIQSVTGYPAIPAGTTIEYLGVLGDKTSIETGSYVGTGTYGSGNPNTLTFRFEPKFVHIQAGNIGKEDSSGFKFAFFVLGTKGFSIGPGSANEMYNLNAKFDGNTLSWYLGNAAQQLNTKSANYFFIALG